MAYRTVHAVQWKCHASRHPPEAFHSVSSDWRPGNEARLMYEGLGTRLGWCTIASDSLIPSFERKPGNEVNRIVQTDRKNHSGFDTDNLNRSDWQYLHRLTATLPFTSRIAYVIVSHWHACPDSSVGFITRLACLGPRPRTNPYLLEKMWGWD